MTVLGIDPGIANTGYGVIERREGRILALDGGLIRTPSSMPTERRLASIHGRILELIREHDCQTLALEQIYFGQNAHSAFAVGQARGVCMLAAGQHGADCTSYTPQQIKAAVCGHGGAEKDQVARMVRMLLSLPSTPLADHVTDALAVAICHLNATPVARALLEASGRGTADAGKGSMRGSAAARAARASSARPASARSRSAISSSSANRRAGGR